MRRSFRRVAALLGAVVLIGTTGVVIVLSDNPISTQMADPLVVATGTYQLESITGFDPAGWPEPGLYPSITLVEGGRFVLDDGCNDHGGRFEPAADGIRAFTLAVTLIGCLARDNDLPPAEADLFDEWSRLDLLRLTAGTDSLTGTVNGVDLVFRAA